MFNGLVKYDKDLSTIVGDLAKNFYFEDAKTLIFKLHENVKWHDGAKLSASDVVFTYNVLISSKISSPYSANFRFVQSVEAVDEFTVRVRYKEPYFKALEIWMMGILPQHLLKEEQNLMNSSFNTKPIGTGAYKLAQLEHSKNILLEAFDGYFEGRAKIDTISFHVIADPMTRFLMLKSGELDVGSIEPMQYERQLNNSFFEKFNIYETISQSYTYLGLNMRDEKFKNPKVREALSLAINREELTNILFFSHAKVCTGPFLPNTPAFNENVKAPKQNIQKAKELLKEAGYDVKNPFTFEIVTNTGNDIRINAAQILQYQLQKAGIIMNIRVMEWQAFLNTVVHPRKFEAVLLGWSLALMPDAYPLWHSSSAKLGGFNLVSYENKKVDELIEKGSSTINRDELGKIYKEIFKTINDDLPYLFLYIPDSITVVNKDIKNIEPSVIGIMHNQKDWEIEK